MGASSQKMPGTGVAHTWELLLVSMKTPLSLGEGICGLPDGAKAPVYEVGGSGANQKPG